MTNILDGLTVEIMGADEEWKCPMPHEQKEFAPKEEDVEPEFNDDKLVPETPDLSAHDTFNSSKKLGASLNQTSDKIDGYKVARVTIEDDTEADRKITVAAHHLIPGNASLKPSALMDYISKSKGVIAENIGYNVNGAENGVWLPGWYAINGWGAMDATDKGRLFRARYVLAVNDKLVRQFHDTHTKYSEFVLGCLDAVHQKMNTTGMYFCEDCKKAKELNGKKPPPYSLVQRLNGISGRFRSKLLGTYSSWKPPIFTSDTWRDLQQTRKISSS